MLSVWPERPAGKWPRPCWPHRICSCAPSKSARRMRGSIRERCPGHTELGHRGAAAGAVQVIGGQLLGGGDVEPPPGAVDVAGGLLDVDHVSQRDQRLDQLLDIDHGLGDLLPITTAHAQRRRCNRCSTTVGVTVGMSYTWRCTTPTSEASLRSAPSAASSGNVIDDLDRSATRDSAAPPAPGCLPGRRPVRRRAERAAGTADPSAEGGCEEFRELRPNWRMSSATSARSSSIWRACAPITRQAWAQVITPTTG